ncbi:hypothetical protein R6Q59_013069 [Mikania micrantha]
MSLNTITSYHHKLSSSGQRFNYMVQDFFENVGPLLSMQLGGKMLDGLFHIFNSYVSIRALLSFIEEANYEGSRNKIVLMTVRTHLRGKIVRMAQTVSKLMALLANASLLADELLPRAATKHILLVQAIFNDL